MTGFKSFADKTVIEFDRGMTAIVGPNGSGKSNLSEAIRWVLGEQSAKSLRGNRMEDVIFNGTPDRKPVNIAKVTLVLNNEDHYLDTDYSEVMVTRVYHRNGTSQYLINNEEVRLKDIVDLFLDSGLGKNSFSMISQGQVEQIFLSKPEERRVIFEEAAGVQRYQYRKQEASRKLNRTQDNLSRVQDIIHEVEGQLKPLKQQRDAALTYQEKAAELKELELTLYTHKIEENKEKWQQAEQELKQKQSELVQTEAEEAKNQQQIDQSKNRQSEVIQANDQLADEYREVSRELQEAKTDQQMLQQRLTHQQETIEQRRQEYQERQSNHQSALAEKQRLEEEKEAKLTAINTLNEEINQLETQRKDLMDDSQTSQSDLQDELIHYYQQEASANNQFNQATQQINRLSSVLDRLSEKEARLNEKKQVEKDQLQYTENHYLALKSQAESQEEEFQTIQRGLADLQYKQDQLKQQVFQSERQFQTADQRYQRLQAEQENYEGYYAGVRYIMKQKNQLDGIIGPVADVIQVSSEYRTAIDTALGSSLQHIIVEDDRAARTAIQRLKRDKAGRATFLPRSNIKARMLSSDLYQTVSQMAGYIGLASDLIEFEVVDKAIILNLLATTVVAATLKEAQAMAKAVGQRVKIVTMEGEVIFPGGSLSGGQSKYHQQSVLDRQEQVEQAKLDLQQAQDKFKVDEASWHQLAQRIEKGQAYIQNQQGQRQELQNKLDAAKQNLSQKQSLVDQIQREMRLLEVDRKETIKEFDDWQTSLQKAQQAQTDSHKAIEATKIRLSQLSTNASEQSQLLDQLTQTIQEKQTRLAVLNVEQNQLVEQLKTLNQTIEKNTNYFSGYQQQVLDYQQETETGHDKLKQLQNKMSLLSQKADQLPDQVSQLRHEREQLSQQINALEKERQAISERKQKIYQIIATTEAAIEKFQSYIDNQLTYLSETYQLSYEAAKAMVTDKDSSKIDEGRVRTLKKQIDRLGPINIQAIADYAQLNERYQLLIEQQTDLLTAMSQLQATMDEMDQEVIKRFGAAFEQISIQFEKTFKILFGGGQAYLELTAPNDLLTTGIDIVAQPPGKRKQHLALLSGGERALTAIALLFAILEVRPVPFVVLDEVEAALDEANVHRYGEYIQNFTQDTQFIVITHRKGTMESADMLYGVTMEKSGISKLASVHLSKVADSD